MKTGPLNTWIIDLAALVEDGGPLLMSEGSQAACEIARELHAIGAIHKETMRQTCEAAKLLGKMEGEYLGRWGKHGEAPVRQPVERATLPDDSEKARVGV